MAIVYKVWIEIEEYDEETGSGETLDAPGADVATFATYDDAVAFAGDLQGIGESIATGNGEDAGAVAVIASVLSDGAVGDRS